jgi:hypothetical protein
VIPLLMTAMTASAQWYTTKIEDDPTGTAVVGVAIRQWGPTDEVFFAVETRDTSSGEHDLHMEQWDCLNAACSSVSPSDGPDELFDNLLHDQYMHPSMAIMRESASDPRVLTVATRDRKRTTCDGNIYELAGYLDRVAIYLDVNSQEWDTSSGTMTGDYAVRLSDTSDDVCENATRTFTKYEKNTKDVHVAYDWNESPDVYMGNDPVDYPQEVYIANRAVSSSSQTQTLVHRDFGEVLWRSRPTFAFDDNADRIAAFHEPNYTVVDFVDESDPWNTDVAFSLPVTSRTWPSISTRGDRIDLVDSEGYATCTMSGTVDCRDDADWSDEELGVGDDAQIVSDGDKLFILTGSGETIQIKTKCVGDTSWSTTTPKTPTGGNKQLAYSGRPSIVLNRQDNVLHVAFVENTTGELNEDDGEAWWARRSYSDCP